jgi:Leucine-rich repeat (LRR) protein
MGVFAADFASVRTRAWWGACAALCLATPLAITSPRPVAADEQIVTAKRGSLTVRPAGKSLQIVEWIGPGSAELAWPSIDPKRYTLLSLRVVPKGLSTVGMVAALTPTWGVDLCGIPVSDDDINFLVKRCRGLSLLRLRHSSTLSSDELSDLSDEERAALNARTLSGEGLAKIERLKRLMLLEISGYSLPQTRLQFLADLNELRWLSLCDMPVADEDLQALSHLPKLTRLDLCGTSVTGSGLRYLCDCPALQTIVLNRSPVTSHLADSLKDHPLPHLQQLHVHGCKLTSDRMSALRSAVPLFAYVVDSDFSLRRLADVTPPEPRNAQEIRVYRAACQLLWGFDVAAFRTTGNTVTDLSIHPRGWMPADGWMLSYLSPLKGLKNLWLGGCNLSADALEQLQAHDQLQWLDLSDSAVDDAALERLAGLKRLRGMNLTKTKLTDAAVETLSQFTNLETLHLAGTQVTDRGLQTLQSQWHLRALDLKQCPISDEGARHLAAMTNLEYIRLDDTKVTDRGVMALAGLPHLRGLSCVNCKITDDAAYKLSHAENLTYCQIEGTSITKSFRTMIADHISDVRTNLRTRFGWSPSNGRSAAESSENGFWNVNDSRSSTQTGPK